jgi:hypothetical protein
MLQAEEMLRKTKKMAKKETLLAPPPSRYPSRVKKAEFKVPKAIKPKS